MHATNIQPSFTVLINHITGEMSMVDVEFDQKLCNECNQPLFFTKQECMEFIERKLKQGHIVCSCCGSPNKVG